MNEIKMIVTDMDGTLLNSEKKISAFTKEVLQKKQSEGVIVAFATARPYRFIVPMFEDFMPDAVSAHNGAALYHDGKVIARHGIPPEESMTIITNLRSKFGNISLSIELDDTIYTNSYLLPEWDEPDSIKSDFSDLPNIPADKIIVYKDVIERAGADRSFLTESTYLQVIEGIMGAVLHKDATKWRTVQDFSRIFDIPMENIACFGDDLNDMEMIEKAGIGVAMENALDEVKAKADYICGHNDEDGLAFWLCQKSS